MGLGTFLGGVGIEKEILVIYEFIYGFDCLTYI